MNKFKEQTGSVLATGIVIAVIALIVGGVGTAIANRKVNDPATIAKGKEMVEQAKKEQVQKRKIKEESKDSSSGTSIDVSSILNLDKTETKNQPKIEKEYVSEAIVVHKAFDDILIINDSGSLYFIETKDINNVPDISEGDSVKITYTGKKESFRDMKVIEFTNILKGEKVDESEATKKDGTPIKIKSFVGERAWVCTNLKTKKDAIYVFNNFNNVVADVLREGDTLVIRAQNANENDALKLTGIKSIVK